MTTGNPSPTSPEGIMKSIKVTPDQLNQIVGLVENAIGVAVRDAFATIVAGYTPPGRKRGRRPIDPSDRAAMLTTRILVALEGAPEGMLTKAALRRAAGNGRPDFDEVLSALLTEGRVTARRAVGLRGRYATIYARAPTTES